MGVVAADEQRAFLPKPAVLANVHGTSRRPTCLRSMSLQVTMAVGQQGRNRLWEAVDGNHQVIAIKDRGWDVQAAFNYLDRMRLPILQ